MKIKYPRTFHLPFSQGVQSDDKIQNDLSVLKNNEIIVTMKMDGENTTIGRDYTHARSLNSGYHPSRNHVKVVQGNIGYMLDENERICGENLYAKHSIHYSDLPDYFLAFSVWNDRTCLSWDDTITRLNELGLKSVPVLYRGEYSEDVIKKLTTNECFYDGTHEGIVVRVSGSFDYDDFSKSVVKWVRANHVQTDKHWTKQEIIPNKVIS